MSASLVGSEMCIRDRRSPERCGRGRPAHRQQTARRKSSKRRCRGRAGPPVAIVRAWRSPGRRSRGRAARNPELLRALLPGPSCSVVAGRPRVEGVLSAAPESSAANLLEKSGPRVEGVLGVVAGGGPLVACGPRDERAPSA
eukprot:3684236-Alexandrium_andersonii.AAC.1